MKKRFKKSWEKGRESIFLNIHELAEIYAEIKSIRIEDASNPLCFDVTSIDITIHPLPIVDTIPNVQECTSYVLPVITNGTYYLLPGGPTTPGQVQYNAGDLIDLGGTYYIFVGRIK